MTDETAPERAQRPPIRSYDQPLDSSGADEVVAKFEKNKADSADGNPVVAAALKLRDEGFSLMPLRTNTKGLPIGDWDRLIASTNIATTLKNPGTQNYAIMPPPGCVILDIDKDAPALIARLTETLGPLPVTRMHGSPHGSHITFRWPEDLDRPKGDWWGEVVARWPHGDEGQGYVVGPGSRTEDGHYIVIFDEPVAELPRGWALNALAWRKPGRVVSTGALAQPVERYVIPDRIVTRYPEVVRYTAHLYNRGMSREEMWPLVRDMLAPNFTEPLTEQRLRARLLRATKDMASRLGEPMAVLSVSAPSSEVPGAPTTRESVTPLVNGGSLVQLAPTSLTTEQPPSQTELLGLSLPTAQTLIEELATREPVQYLVPGWVPARAWTIIGGHPKSMKSLATLQMLGAYVQGVDWLTGQHIEMDGFSRFAVYVTQEGSDYDTEQRLRNLVAQYPLSATRVFVLYQQVFQFDKAGFDLLEPLLSDIPNRLAGTGEGKPQGLVVFDPLRDFMPLGSDENEAKAMAPVKAYVRETLNAYPWSTVMTPHHTRKSATGRTGLELSGSGAVYGGTDSVIIWRSKTATNFEEAEDELDEFEEQPLVRIEPMHGDYRIEMRGAAPRSGHWLYDNDKSLIVPGRGVKPVRTQTGRVEKGAGKDAVLEAVRSTATAGATNADVASMTGLPDNNVRAQTSRLLKSEQLVRVDGRFYIRRFSPSVTDEGLLPEDEVVSPDPLHDL